jgi:hypothetical protein
MTVNKQNKQKKQQTIDGKYGTRATEKKGKQGLNQNSPDKRKPKKSHQNKVTDENKKSEFSKKYASRQ